MFIFLDESGDLGFDFQNKKSSRYFAITLLVCHSVSDLFSFKSAVKKTLREKFNFSKTKCPVLELKGSGTHISIKKYFYDQLGKLSGKNWNIYTIVLDKALLLNSLHEAPEAHRLYNLLSKEILGSIDYSMIENNVHLVVDKCKGSKERNIFDNYLKMHLESALPLNKKFNISHENSHENPALQAVDLFCHGIMRKYGDMDLTWYSEFSDRIQVEMTWPKN